MLLELLLVRTPAPHSPSPNQNRPPVAWGGRSSLQIINIDNIRLQRAGGRVRATVHIYAYVPISVGDESVNDFKRPISVKDKSVNTFKQL